MALLLAMYQKMRLIREKNQLVLDQSKFSSKLTRIEKNIANQQKRYASLFSQLESQASAMKTNANMFFQNMSGLGCGIVNPMNYTGMNGFTYGVMANMFKSDITGRTDSDGNALPDVQLGSDLFKKMYQEYMSNGGKFLYELDKDNKQVYDESGNPKYKNFEYEQVQAFIQAQQTAQMQQSQAQMWVQNANTQYANNISIWFEAEKARLEAEQDAVLSPLNEQQTMLELEKEQTDARLTRINSELEIYKELCSQEAKNTAPTFGLR